MKTTLFYFSIIAMALTACTKKEFKNNCSTRLQPEILGDSSNVALPTAFTPNGDGRNDVFHVLTGHITEFSSFSLSVSKPNGKEVFSTADYNKRWNPGGEASGKYYVKLKYTTTTGATGEQCSFVYALEDNDGCVKLPKKTEYLTDIVFGDMYNFTTAQFAIPTSETICN